MYEFPRAVNLHCKRCNRSPLFVYAYELSENTAIPLLVCDPHFGCGKVFEFEEYGFKGWKERDYRDWLVGIALVL